MKKIIATVLILCFLLTGCTYKGGKNYTAHTTLVEIATMDNLYYDPQTKIVYIMFSEAFSYQGYGYMSAYYASNGLPYIYDVANSKLVEIEYDNYE